MRVPFDVDLSKGTLTRFSIVEKRCVCPHPHFALNEQERTVTCQGASLRSYRARLRAGRSSRFSVLRMRAFFRREPVMVWVMGGLFALGAVMLSMCISLYLSLSWRELNMEIGLATQELHATLENLPRIGFPRESVLLMETLEADEEPETGSVQGEFPRAGLFRIVLQPGVFNGIIQEKILQALRDNIRRTPREGTQVAMGALPAHGRISSSYGYRRDPFGKRKWVFHHGLDIAARKGSPSFCMWPGIVVRAGWNGSYGYMVEVYHGRQIFTRYAHLSRILTRRGQFLNRGEILGLVGSTGRSTGPHLHFEIRYRKRSVDPLKYLLLEYMSGKSKQAGA